MKLLANQVYEGICVVDSRERRHQKSKAKNEEQPAVFGVCLENCPSVAPSSNHTHEEQTASTEKMIDSIDPSPKTMTKNDVPLADVDGEVVRVVRVES